MIFSHRRADKGAAQPQRGLFLRIAVCFCCLTLTAGGAAAGAGYGLEPGALRVSEGGGTWGDILEMSAAVRGSSILFTVRKKNGLPFHTRSEISIRTGSRNGPTAASGIVPIDSSAVSLKARLNKYGEEESYYAYLFNSYGHAWVGPLKLSGDSGFVAHEPTGRDVSIGYPFLENRSGPSKPRLENLPASVPLHERVLINVRAGACPDGGKVRVQCFAEAEGRSGQHESALVWSGSLLQIPFRFDQPGEQSIFCATVSRCCSSPWVSGTVNVQQERPSSKISRSETKINISVVTDADGRANSKVSVQNSRTEDCAPFCGGEISYDRPYLPEAEDPSYAMPYDTPPDGTYVLPDAVPDL